MNTVPNIKLAQPAFAYTGSEAVRGIPLVRHSAQRVTGNSAQVVNGLAGGVDIARFKGGDAVWTWSADSRIGNVHARAVTWEGC